MALNRGSKAAEQEAQKSRANFARAEYFSMKAGDTLTFRLIDRPEDWIFTKQHAYVPTKGAPEDADAKVKENWPKRMGAVCRKDDAVKEQTGNKCHICDNMVNERNKSGKFTAPVRLWARMIVREPVEGTQAMVDQGMIKEHQLGKVVGFQDKMIQAKEIDADGKETGQMITRPQIVVANMAQDNFFGALDGFNDVYADEGGILNRDITVTRKGEDTDTTYNFTPRGVTKGFDLADPATRAQYDEHIRQARLDNDSLERMILDHASDDYYARYFDETKPFPKAKKSAGESEGAPAEQQQKPPEDEATQEKLAAMRAKLKGDSGRPAEDTAPVAEESAADSEEVAVNFNATV